MLDQKFFEKVKEFEAAKDKYLKLKEELDVLMQHMAINSYYQDPSTGIVYKIEVPKGRFVHFDQISYSRTKMAGETRGSLSKKEAEEAGFVVK